MAVPPITIQHVFTHFNSAEVLLDALASEQDPERQRTLASAAHAHAALAQAAATWLSYTSASKS